MEICPETCRTLPSYLEPLPSYLEPAEHFLPTGGGWLGSLHLLPVEMFLLLLLRPLRVEGIYSQKLKVYFGACLDTTVGAAGQDKGSCGLCHNQPSHPELIYNWDNWDEPLAESMARVKAGPC